MPQLLFLSPMVPSTNVGATADFLVKAFGFSRLDLDGYAICTKDGLTLHLQPAGEDIGEMSVYLEVDDVEEAWEQMKPHLEGIRHKPPFDREYGMREVHLDLPHTKTLLFVGQSI